MNRILIVTSLFFTFSISAKINASYSDCIKLYGKVLKEVKSKDYAHVQWEIAEGWVECIFYKGKVVMHSVFRKKPTFTEKEVIKISNKLIGTSVLWKKEKNKYWAYRSKDYYLLANKRSITLSKIDLPKDFDEQTKKLNLYPNKKK